MMDADIVSGAGAVATSSVLLATNLLLVVIVVIDQRGDMKREKRESEILRQRSLRSNGEGGGGGGLSGIDRGEDFSVEMVDMSTEVEDGADGAGTAAVHVSVEAADMVFENPLHAGQASATAVPAAPAAQVKHGDNDRPHFKDKQPRSSLFSSLFSRTSQRALQTMQVCCHDRCCRRRWRWRQAFSSPIIPTWMPAAAELPFAHLTWTWHHSTSRARLASYEGSQGHCEFIEPASLG